MPIYMTLTRLLLLGVAITGVLSQSAIGPPSPKAAAANVMALEGKYADMDAPIKLIKNNEEELAAYLSDPDTVCTFFMPNGAALQDSIKRLGKYAGKAAQNASLGRSTMNYHVVPGRALTAEDLLKGTINRTLSRANETLYFWREKGKPYVYARPDVPSVLNRTDIRAGKCIVHTINRALVPPSANDMIQAWLEELGTMPATPPKAQWAPQQQPLPDSLEAGDRPAAAAAPAPATSSSGSGWMGFRGWCSGSGAVAIMTAALVAAAAA